MSRKTLIWIGMFIGSGIGGYLPVLWGGGLVSFSSIFLSAVGGLAGIYAGYRLSRF